MSWDVVLYQHTFSFTRIKKEGHEDKNKNMGSKVIEDGTFNLGQNPLSE